MWVKYKEQNGFTIVELLIVIVVIAILATITLITFNGAQQRAQNTQTISAVTSWVKILRLYQAENGNMPTGIASCLGSQYPYGATGTDPSGFQCRQDTTTSGITVSQTFLNMMKPYSSSNPQPSTVAVAVSSPVTWYRGAYYYPTLPARIDFVLAGKGTQCPTIGGLIFQVRQVFDANDSVRCVMNFGGDS